MVIANGDAKNVMKKCHRKPARGSYKEAKAIEQKKIARSFFDFTEKEKQEIMLKAVLGANEMQRKMLEEYEKTVHAQKNGRGSIV